MSAKSVSHMKTSQITEIDRENSRSDRENTGNLKIDFSENPVSSMTNITAVKFRGFVSHSITVTK